MTVIIRHPANRNAERAYIYDVVFRDFLGLEYDTRSEDRDDVAVSVQGADTELRVADVLFQLNDADWLHSRSLPEAPLERWRIPTEVAAIMDVAIEQVPVLFGRPDESGRLFAQRDMLIDLRLDLFGSIFFMLTRYEEGCGGELDEFGRYPSSASLAVREGFIERPIVNEYLEILWGCLRILQPALSRVRRDYEVVMSHDVDRMYDTVGASWSTVARNVFGDLFRRRDWYLAVRRLYSRSLSRRGVYEHEPCNTFDYIMDIGEQFNIRSAFFFLVYQGTDGRDGDYSIDTPWVRKLLRNIHARGHELGLHASYGSYNDPAQIAREMSKLQEVAVEENIAREAWGGRQHYLRWSVCTTWQGWEDAGLAYDSTLAFPEVCGFRAGTCFEYPAFNLRLREALGLRERPLVVMETSLFSQKYMNLSAMDATEKIIELSATCKKFGGCFTLLWHNDKLATREQKHLYRSVLETLS